MKYLLVFMLASSCSLFKNPKEAPKKIATPKQKMESVSTQAKQIANENETNLVAEIPFKKGSTDLSPTAISELKSLYYKAKARGKIDQVKLITWADQEYPTKRQEKLSRDQQKLVDGRNENLDKALEDIGDLKVKKISMAERPDEFAKFLKNDEADTKKSLERADIPTTNSNQKVPGKASKSIVIFVMEE